MDSLSLVKTTVQSVQVRHSSADKTMILFVVVSKMVNREYFMESAGVRYLRTSC